MPVIRHTIAGVTFSVDPHPTQPDLAVRLDLYSGEPATIWVDQNVADVIDQVTWALHNAGFLDDSEDSKADAIGLFLVERYGI